MKPILTTYFNTEFQTYYQTCEESAKRLLKWCVLSNFECPEEYKELYFDSADEDTILSSFFNEKETLLEPFDRATELNLMRLFDTLDGTLLVDLVYREITNHKIFK